MNETEYELDLKINVLNLHNEFLKHPSLCAKYIKLAAEAQMEYERAKENFDVVKSQGKEEAEKVKSEIDLDIRNHPENYDVPVDKNGNAKLTENIITSAVITSLKYQNVLTLNANNRKNAHEKMINACFERDLLKGAVDTFCYQRKSALEHNVRLWEQEFYSVPNLPKEIKDQKISKVEDQTKNATRKLTRRNING